MNLLKPNLYINKIDDLELEKLSNLGIKNLLIDIDNTLVPYTQVDSDARVEFLLKSYKDLGFKVFIVSNNTKDRVEKFSKGLQTPYYYFALKPLSFIYKKIIRKYNLKVKETACIGDQLLTDVFGANRMGLFTIYVDPLVTKDGPFTFLNRKIEKRIMNNMKMKNELKIGVINDKM